MNICRKTSYILFPKSSVANPDHRKNTSYFLFSNCYFLFSAAYFFTINYSFNGFPLASVFILPHKINIPSINPHKEPTPQVTKVTTI